MIDMKAEFQWYLDHQAELVKKYNNKYIVVVDHDVVLHGDSQADMYEKAVKKYGLGNFMLQRCSDGDKDYTARFHTPGRVQF